MIVEVVSYVTVLIIILLANFWKHSLGLNLLKDLTYANLFSQVWWSRQWFILIFNTTWRCSSSWWKGLVTMSAI